jgi:branched-chain amino acid transport system permease protein
LDTVLQSVITGIGDATIYVMLGVGLALMYGVLDIVNFAQGDFMTVAAYVGLYGMVHIGLNPVLALVLMAPAGAVLGAVFYGTIVLPTDGGIRERRLLATFGCAILIEGIVSQVFGVNPTSAQQSGSAYHLGGLVFSFDLLENLAVAAISVGLLFAFLNGTQLGREVRATGQNPRGAQLTGINVRAARLIAATFAGALTGAGGFMLLTNSLLTPQVGFGYILDGFAVVILGGLGSVTGAIYASILIGVVTELVTTLISATLADLVPFLVIIAVLLIRPEGLLRGRAS